MSVGDETADSTNVEKQAENDAKNCKCGGNLDERRELLDELIEWAAIRRAEVSVFGGNEYNRGRATAFADVMRRLNKLKDCDGASVSADEDVRNATASASFPVTTSPPTHTCHTSMRCVPCQDDNGEPARLEVDNG